MGLHLEVKRAEISRYARETSPKMGTKMRKLFSELN